jgi:hypothetical protein
MFFELLLFALFGPCDNFGLLPLDFNFKNFFSEFFDSLIKVFIFKLIKGVMRLTHGYHSGELASGFHYYNE